MTSREYWFIFALMICAVCIGKYDDYRGWIFLGCGLGICLFAGTRAK